MTKFERLAIALLSFIAIALILLAVINIIDAGDRARYQIHALRGGAYVLDTHTGDVIICAGLKFGEWSKLPPKEFTD